MADAGDVRATVKGALAAAAGEIDALEARVRDAEAARGAAIARAAAIDDRVRQVAALLLGDDANVDAALRARLADLEQQLAAQRAANAGLVAARDEALRGVRAAERDVANERDRADAARESEKEMRALLDELRDSHDTIEALRDAAVTSRDAALARVTQLEQEALTLRAAVALAQPAESPGDAEHSALVDRQRLAHLEQENASLRAASTEREQVVARIAESLRDLERIEGDGDVYEVETAVAGLIEDYTSMQPAADTRPATPVPLRVEVVGDLAPVDDDGDEAPRIVLVGTREAVGAWARAGVVPGASVLPVVGAAPTARADVEDRAASEPRLPAVVLVADPEHAGPSIVMRVTRPVDERGQDRRRWLEAVPPVGQRLWSGAAEHAAVFATQGEAYAAANAAADGLNGAHESLHVVPTERVPASGDVFVITRVNSRPELARVFRSPSDTWGPLERAQWFSTREKAEASKPRGARIVTLAEAPTLGVGRGAELPLGSGAAATVDTAEVR